MYEIIDNLLFLILGLFIGAKLTKLSIAKNNVVLEEEIKYEKKEKQVLQHRISELELDLQQQQQQFLADLEEKQYLFQQEINQYKTEKEQLQLALVKKTSDFDRLNQSHLHQEEVTLQLRENFKIEFELLAQRIFEEKTNTFSQKSKDQISTILQPLQQRLENFERKVDQTHKDYIISNASLKEQILGLKDLNQQMSQETLNLTKALKGDNKVQGNWGELVLERVLEKSGLEKDREYFVQSHFIREDGSRALPDVIIKLPDDKQIVVDSKVTLVAYEKYVNQDDDTLKQEYLKQHVQALQRHVDQLSAKNYQDLSKSSSLDFVLLFVPIETAFSVVINTDPNMYNRAFEKNIVIVTPSTLLATLRTIDTMWNTEKQQRNALEIAKQAGALYDKFYGLITDLTNVSKKMQGVQKDFDLAMNKLSQGRGNLISSVEKLKKMGAKAKKTLPDM